MSRYIDADAFERAVMFSDDEDIQDVIYRLRDFPTADVVKVVRCKDCKYYRKNISCVGGLYNGCSEWLNEGNEIEVREDDYCSFGERREDDK